MNLHFWLDKTHQKATLSLAMLLFCICSAQNVIEIEVKGNKRTKSSFLHKVLYVKQNEPLDSTRIERDIQQLRKLPSIAHAYYKVSDSGLEEGFKVEYVIEENFTLIPFASVYSTNNDEFAFRIGLQEFNTLGQNITVGVFYQDDIFSSFGVNVRAPFLYKNKLGLAVNYQDLTTQEPVFLDDGTAEYKYNNRSFEVLGLYQIDLKNRVELGYNAFTEDYEYLFGSTDPDVPLALEVDKFLLKFIYEHDALKYHYQYVDGFRNTFNGQYVNSSNEDQLPQFVLFFNDFSYFKRVGKRGNWANRLRLGISSNLDTPFAPFAVDNNLNIRGVGNTIDRGTAAIVYNTEYRHTLIDENWFVLQGNVFVDGGTWRNPGGNLGDFADNSNIRVYPGIGLRFIHKRIFNAIFRIDYGYGITNNALRGVVFGIGQYF